MPLKNPDFAPFLQRVADDKPDAVFVFVPSGFGAVTTHHYSAAHDSPENKAFIAAFVKANGCRPQGNRI